MNDATLGFFGAIFGSILGSYLTYRSTDQLNKEQQLNELKNIAKAMDINFESFSNSELVKYAELYVKQRSKRQPQIHSFQRSSYTFQ
ncbi:hypothetical protein [Methanosarcina sp. UBA411]|jgi:arsenate reductase-like glutaredoxin family protein|uniref:hypothetical protein n=1 Tax=Methanosarcina sp. UBA411 TaxID=1915589 RepID=UPI0025DC4BE3|nr:hypothetical protein [Methanosarcina sp. UBA411]